MKKIYESPVIGFEQYRANQSVAAGNCTPRGQDGYDEDKDSMQVQCEISHLHLFGTAETVLFSDKNNGCATQVKAADFGAATETTVHWDGWLGSNVKNYHSYTVKQPTYFYS